jgi:hypothetical protein
MKKITNILMLDERSIYRLRMSKHRNFYIWMQRHTRGTEDDERFRHLMERLLSKNSMLLTMNSKRIDPVIITPLDS